MVTKYRDEADGTHALVVALGAGDENIGEVDIAAGGTVSVIDPWTITLQSDVTLADSDKVFTVPAGYLWQVLWAWVELTTTATVGDRQLEVDFRSASDVIGQVRPNAVQAASLLRNYMIGPAIANQAAFYDTDHLQTPLPPTVFLPAGYSVRVFDNNAVDAAGDNMIVHMMVAQKAV